MTKIRHRGEMESLLRLRAQFQKDHEEYIERVKAQHKATMESMTSTPIYEVQRNETDVPLVLYNGVVVQPGGYYVEGERTFGISEQEYEAQYEEVE
jgi:hypothetical protein